MKVALVSKTNGYVGGASFFAENLGAWLMESGHEVVHFCTSPKSELLGHQRVFDSKGLVSRVVRHINWRARRLGAVEPLPWEYWFGLRQVLREFDVFHFHDLYMAISSRTLSSVAKQRPVVLTLHDCSPFTGGCTYPITCRRHRDRCGNCPQKAKLGRFDFTRLNLKQMRAMARSANLTYVCPSEWIRSEAIGALGAQARLRHIPNGFDPRPYCLRPRTEARDLLGLPPEAKVVIISAAALGNELKGVRFALDALLANRDLNPLVLAIGQISADLEPHLRGNNFVLPGFIKDRTQLGLYYSAADLLLFTSLAENLPITIQESMAAGTPVLAFAVGGVVELVQPGRTGWLVPTGDQPALNHKLREVLQSENISAHGERGRALAQEEFSMDRCLASHLLLYRNVSKAVSFREVAVEASTY